MINFRLSVLFLLALLSICISCDEQAACEDIGYLNTIKVSDANNNPVFLDAHYTLRSTTGDTIRAIAMPQPFDSTVTKYQFFSDNTNYTSEAGENFDVVGVIGDTTVFTETYFVSHDGCHVTMETISGPDSIVVDL